MSNPLILNKKLPGRSFQLPSKGFLYKENMFGENSKDGEIHVHPLTTFTELDLKNPDLLFNGKAIENVVKECVPEIKKPLELYGRDVDALLFFLRLCTYGSEYVIEVKHDCEKAEKHSYIVNLEQIVSSMKFLDKDIIETMRKITINIDGDEYVVTVRPLKFLDVIKLFHFSENKKELSTEDIKELARINILSMIEDVNGTNNPEHINEWVNTLTSPNINKITKAASELNDWGPDQIATLKCKDCGKEMKVELPLNPVSFFTE